MVDQKMNEFLAGLGVPAEAANIYLVMVGRPARSAGEVAKASGVPKTTVYRRLEELITVGLVEERIEEHKRLYRSTPPEMLELLVVKRKQQAEESAAQLPYVLNLMAPVASQDPETKVLFYRGRDGIQQMNWNVLKTKGEMCGFTFRAWEEIVGEKYALDFLAEFSERGFKGREIYSDEYLRSREGRRDPNPKWPNWQSRYIDPKILTITHQMDIYNDVVAIYNWHKGEVFGVEIYNHKVADMHKQIFNVLWRLAG